jgi:UDP-2,4-diacetamido-2,4,6-trideoxy-beta-L-altropyranose hydrolase
VSKVLFRVDASKEMGLGHLMRCLLLADYLSDFNYEIYFLCNPFPGGDYSKVIKKGYVLELLPQDFKYEPNSITGDDLDYKKWLGRSSEDDARYTLDFIKRTGVDCIVVDHYGIDVLWESLVFGQVRKSVVIDDLANRNHCSDFLIDYSVGRRKFDYSNLVSSSTKLLCGEKFFMASKELVKTRKASSSNFDKLEKVIVVLGGSDCKNDTKKLFDIFECDVNLEDIRFTFVLSEANPYFNELKSRSNENIKVTGFLNNLLSVIGDFDLCIGSLGVSAYERLALGVPSINIKTASNQSNNFLNIQKYFGKNNYQSKSIDRVSYISKLLEGIGFDTVFTDGKGSKTVGPFGINRVLKEMWGINLYRVQKASVSELEHLYHWQNHPGTRKYSRIKRPPSWKEHQLWYLKSLEMDGRELYFAYFLDRPVGYLRLDRGRLRNEVSVVTAPGYEGQGIGSFLLRYIRNLTTDNLDAYINPQNDSSIFLFMKNNYKQVDLNWFRCEK